MFLATVLDCVENLLVTAENCTGQHCYLRARVSGGVGRMSINFAKETGEGEVKELR